MYSGQVNRLMKEIADLRGKVADERRRMADANSKAFKAMDALNKAKSPSHMSSNARDVERHQKAAAGHEKRAAALERTIAQKQQSLTSAERSLTQAKATVQKKHDREAERRRAADLDHIKRLERERRATATFPAALTASPRRTIALGPTRTSPAQFTDRYDICLSFAGEQRDYVQWIAEELKAAGLDVFYDQDEDIAPKLWGRDLGEYLDYIYRRGSRFCLMFISADYANKAWTVHERRSALARVIEEGDDYVLPARWDDTELPGLRPTTGYLDLRQIAPATLVDFVLKKLADDG